MPLRPPLLSSGETPTRIMRLPVLPEIKYKNTHSRYKVYSEIVTVFLYLISQSWRCPGEGSSFSGGGERGRTWKRRGGREGVQEVCRGAGGAGAVSYTHLTLPTICSV
eukprot:2362502-Rhodomonas_salina.3